VDINCTTCWYTIIRYICLIIQLLFTVVIYLKIRLLLILTFSNIKYSTIWSYYENNKNLKYKSLINILQKKRWKYNRYYFAGFTKFIIIFITLISTMTIIQHKIHILIVNSISDDNYFFAIVENLFCIFYFILWLWHLPFWLKNQPPPGHLFIPISPSIHLHSFPFTDIVYATKTKSTEKIIDFIFMLFKIFYIN
jgi:hypothetical protein